MFTHREKNENKTQKLNIGSIAFVLILFRLFVYTSSVYIYEDVIQIQ